MSKIEAFARPRSLEEALSIKALRKQDAMPLAGGTAIAKMVGLHRPWLMDLRDVGLDGVDAAGDPISIGAMARVADLEACGALNDATQGVFRALAANLGSEPLRRMITAGGNAFQVFTWSELPTLFMGLGARFELQRVEAKREVSADDLYARHPRNLLRPDELLTRVLVPPVGAGDVASYERFSLAQADYAALSLAVVVRDGGADTRVAVGGLWGLPRRLGPVEEILAGAPPTWDAARVRALIMDWLPKPQPHVQFSPEYRQRLCAELVSARVAAIAEGWS
jgi:aerobic carbon-monoxide dehydrogenase medium subunit